MKNSNSIHWQLAFVLSSTLLIGACNNVKAPIYGVLLRDAAIDKFSKDQSCPKDRIAVDTLALDMRPQDILLTTAIPPSDVSADPARLATWNENTVGNLADHFNYLSAENVRGCGLERSYFCYAEPRRHDDDYDCLDVDLDNPEATFYFGKYKIAPTTRANLLQRARASGTK